MFRRLAISRPRFLAGLALTLPVLVLFSPCLLSGSVLGGVDSRELFRPRAIWAREAFQRDGTLLWWNPYMFGGTPGVGDFEGVDPIYYPPCWIFLFLQPEVAQVFYFLSHVGLSVVGLYRLARFMGVGRPGGVLSAISYGLSFVSIGRISAGHLGHYSTMAQAPLVILLLLRLLRKPSPGRMAALSAGIALVLVSGIPQFILQLGLVCVFILCWRSTGFYRRRERWVKPALGALGAAGLGILLVSLYLLPAFETAAWALRTPGSSVYDGPPPRHHAFVFENFLYFFIPYFPFSEGAAALMRRDLAHEKGVFMGLFPLLCAAVAVGSSRRSEVRLLTLLGIGALLDAMARELPFHALLGAVVPTYSSYRVPARSMWVVVLSLSLLSGLGWEELRKGASGLRFILGFCGGALLLVAGLVGVRLRAPVEAAVLAVTGLLAAGLSTALAKGIRWAPPAALSFAAANLLVWGMPRLPLVSPASLRDPPWYAPYVRGSPGDYRVLNLVARDLPSTSFGFRQMDGYGHPIVSSMARYYAGAWDDYRSPSPVTLGGGSRVKAPEVLDNLNVRWIVARGSVADSLIEIARHGDQILYENPGAHKQAFLTGPGSVDVSRSSNRIFVRCRADRPARLVVSESWMPGWRARLDGRRAVVEPCLGALVSVEIPEGDHFVEFRYAPTVLLPAIILSLAGGAILLMLGILAWRDRFPRTERQAFPTVKR